MILEIMDFFIENSYNQNIPILFSFPAYKKGRQPDISKNNPIRISDSP